MLRLLILLSLVLLLSLGSVEAEDIAGTDSNEKDLPLFVAISAKWCTSCQSLKPVIEELQYQYQGKVRFLTLDNSSKQTVNESLELAEKEGIKEFYENNKATLPVVGIFCGAKDKAIKEFKAQTEKEPYETYLDDLLIDSTKLCSIK